MLYIIKQFYYLTKNVSLQYQQYNNGYLFWCNSIKTLQYHFLIKHVYFQFNYILKKNSLYLILDNLRWSTYFYNYKIKRNIFIYNLSFNLIYNQLQTNLLNINEKSKRFLCTKGIGYKFFVNKNILTIQLNESHTFNLKVPSFIKILTNKKAIKLSLKTYKYYLIKKMMARIRFFGKPNMYLGKGIRYKYEKLTLKENNKKRL